MKKYKMGLGCYIVFVSVLFIVSIVVLVIEVLMKFGIMKATLFN